MVAGELSIKRQAWLDLIIGLRVWIEAISWNRELWEKIERPLEMRKAGSRCN